MDAQLKQMRGGFQQFPHNQINRSSLRHSYSLDSAVTAGLGNSTMDDDDVDEEQGYDSDTAVTSTAASRTSTDEAFALPARKRSGSFPPPSAAAAQHSAQHRTDRGISKENADSFFRAILGAIYDERPQTPETVEQLEITRLRNELAMLRAEITDIGKFLLEGVGDTDDPTIARTSESTDAPLAATLASGEAAEGSGDDISRGGTPDLNRKNADGSGAGLDRRTRASAWVYVLWDIENVSVPKQLNPKTGAESSGFKVCSHWRRIVFTYWQRICALCLLRVTDVLTVTTAGAQSFSLKQ
eukprot:m.1628396 g.1628396  ORF g.1628396 m.1628396 type:complete len:299 (-) comp25396_c0_seq70:7966-8862(-)